MKPRATLVHRLLVPRLLVPRLLVPRLLVPCAVLAFAACAGAADDSAEQPSVTRQFLSAGANDWEPSLAVDGKDAVHIIGGRREAVAAGSSRPLAESRIVTWTSTDGGRSFLPVRTFPHGGGDERIKGDLQGTIYATWIRAERDSVTRQIDLTRSGLTLAVSTDRARSWDERLVATIASGVADKPELLVSPDGRDIYIAFMGRGTLDVVASHDGGHGWARHTIDTSSTGHWPTSAALAPNGDLWFTDTRDSGIPADSILTIDVVIAHSTDGGVTWRRRDVSRSTRVRAIGGCVHGPTCPVQIAYAAVAVDGRGRVSVAYTEGRARQRYELKLVRSEDSGQSWSDPVIVSAEPRASSGDEADHFYPMIAASGEGLVYLAWFDDREGPLHLWARRSNDGGVSWSPDVRLSRPEGLAGIYGEYGGIGIDSHGTLHVAWSDGTGHVSRPDARGGTWYARWDGRPER